MRLGGWYNASNLDELDDVCQKLDKHGLSAVVAPAAAIEWPEEHCATYGQRAGPGSLTLSWGNGACGRSS